MSLFNSKFIAPTIYNPKLHGVMTDAEREAYNQKLLRRIPERSLKQMADRLLYECCMLCDKDLNKIIRFKPGFDADLAWESYDRAIRSSLLVTKKEYWEMRHEWERKEQLEKEAAEGRPNILERLERTA